MDISSRRVRWSWETYGKSLTLVHANPSFTVTYYQDFNARSKRLRGSIQIPTWTIPQPQRWNWPFEYYSSESRSHCFWVWASVSCCCRPIKNLVPEPHCLSLFCFKFFLGEYRVCPGRHFLDASLYMAVSNVLAVYNIKPPNDDEGNEVKLREEVTGGMLSSVDLLIWDQTWSCFLTDGLLYE